MAIVKCSIVLFKQFLLFSPQIVSNGSKYSGAKFDVVSELFLQTKSVLQYLTMKGTSKEAGVDIPKEINRLECKPIFELKIGRFVLLENVIFFSILLVGF